MSRRGRTRHGSYHRPSVLHWIGVAIVATFFLLIAYILYFVVQSLWIPLFGSFFFHLFGIF